MIDTIKYDSKTADTIRSMFGELECLRNTLDSCQSQFISYFQHRLYERYLFTLHNCFESNIDETDIFNIDIIYKSAIKYVKDAIQCTRNAFIFNVLNDHLEILERAYDAIENEKATILENNDNL